MKKIKIFYNPEINQPNDFDWEETKVKYNLDQFKCLQEEKLILVENQLLNVLGEMVSTNSKKGFVYDRKKLNNSQRLINLLYDVRDLISIEKEI